MNDIPDTLEVDLNTNIPGFQTMRYKPYMSIPTIGQRDDHIIFNPLIRLEKSKITDVRIPEQIQRKQFLNQGLFDSMVYFHNTRQADTLEQAIDNGLIDRNIKITLDTLFKPNTKIYIHNQPYTVIDYTWKPGAWKIDVKSESTPNRFNINKIRDPYLYSDVKNSQMREGTNALNQLSDKVRYGKEYDKSTTDDSSFLGKGLFDKKTPPPKPKTTLPPPPPPPPKIFPPPPPPPKTDHVPYENNPVPNFINHYKRLGAKRNATPIQLKDAYHKKALLTHPDRNKGNKKNVPFTDIKESYDLLNDPARRRAYDLEYDNIGIDEDEDEDEVAEMEDLKKKQFTPPVAKPSAPEPFMYPVTPSSTPAPNVPPKPNVPVPPKQAPKPVPASQMPRVEFTESKNTDLFRAYLKNPDYVDLINSIYRRTLRNSKDFPQLIDTYIAPGTYNIDKDTYNQAVDQLIITNNYGGGDCFFIAIADAVNNSNEQNEDSLITHGVIGRDNRIFTQLYIRSIVADDIINGVIDIDSLLLVVSPELSEELNEIFRLSVAMLGMSQVEAEALILSNNPPDINKVKSEIRKLTEPKYLELLADTYSNHTNTFVMLPETYSFQSIKDKLNPFQPYDKADKEGIRKYIMSKSYWADDLAIASVSKAMKINIIPISQVMHVTPIKLITSIIMIAADKGYNKNIFLYHNGFHYELITLKKPLLTISVFDENELPPFFLLFFLYGHYYYKLSHKENCNLYMDIMKYIDEGFISHYEANFIKKFARMFPENTRMLTQKVGAFMVGGQGDITQLYKRNSDLAYNIVIELELYKGILNDEQLKDVKCQYKRKKIQNAYEELFGLPHARIPDYKLIPKQQTRKFYPRNNITYKNNYQPTTYSNPSYSNYNKINPTNYTRRYTGGIKPRHTRKKRN